MNDNDYHDIHPYSIHILPSLRLSFEPKLEEPNGTIGLQGKWRGAIPHLGVNPPCGECNHHDER